MRRHLVGSLQAGGGGIDGSRLCAARIEGAIQVDIKRQRLGLRQRHHVIGVAVVLVPDVFETAGIGCQAEALGKLVAGTDVVDRWRIAQDRLGDSRLDRATGPAIFIVRVAIVADRQVAGAGTPAAGIELEPPEGEEIRTNTDRPFLLLNS